MRGRVTWVDTRVVGSWLTAGASTTDTVLSVVDPGIFELVGSSGQCLINDQTYTIDSVDSDASTITLTSGLVADLDEDEFVAVYPVRSVKMVGVITGDTAGDEITATVPHDLRAYEGLADGIRTVDAGDTVTVVKTGDGYVVSEVHGREPAIDGDALADGTITETKITDGSISTPKLAANAVTADKIDANAVTADKIEATAIDGKTITGAIVQTSATAPRTAMESDKFLSQNAEGTSVEVQDGSFRAFNDFGEASISYIGDSSFSGLGILSGSGINESDELVDGGPITSTATQHNWSLPGATGDDVILPGQMVLDRDNGLTVATNGDWPLFRKILTLHMDDNEAFTSGNYRYPVVGLDDAVVNSGSDTVALEWMEYLSDLTSPFIKIYKSGLYRVWWRPVWEGNTSGHRYAAIEVNGTITDRDTRTPGGTTTSFRQDLTVERWFDADDVIRFTAMQNAGSIDMIGSSGGYRTTAGIEYLGYNPSV